MFVECGDALWHRLKQRTMNQFAGKWADVSGLGLGISIAFSCVSCDRFRSHQLAVDKFGSFLVEKCYAQADIQKRVRDAI